MKGMDLFRIMNRISITLPVTQTKQINKFSNLMIKTSRFLVVTKAASKTVKISIITVSMIMTSSKRSPKSKIFLKSLTAIKRTQESNSFRIHTVKVSSAKVLRLKTK